MQPFVREKITIAKDDHARGLQFHLRVAGAAALHRDAERERAGVIALRVEHRNVRAVARSVIHLAPESFGRGEQAREAEVGGLFEVPIEGERLRGTKHVRAHAFEALRDRRTLVHHDRFERLHPGHVPEAHHADHGVVLQTHAAHSQPFVQVRRLVVCPAGADENSALPLPIFREQLQVALREIKPRPEDRDHARVIGNLVFVRELQRVEFQVLPCEEFAEAGQLTGAAVVFAVRGDEVELVLLRLREFEQRAREDLLALEAEHLRLAAHHHRHLVQLLELREVAAVHELVPSLVRKDHHVLVRAEFVLRLEFLGPREVRIRVHFLDGQLALRGELILAEQQLRVIFHLAGHRKHHDHLHRLLQCAEQRLRLRAEGDVLAAAPVEARIIFVAEPVQHHERRDHERDLHDDVEAHLDPSGGRSRRLCGLQGVVLFHGS